MALIGYLTDCYRQVVARFLPLDICGTNPIGQPASKPASQPASQPAACGRTWFGSSPNTLQKQLTADRWLIVCVCVIWDGPE